MRGAFATALFVTLFVPLGSPAASAQDAAADRPADRAAIRAHIESIFQAFVDKDRPKLETTHGADWRGFTPWSGHVIRGRDGYMNEATFPPDLPKDQGMVGYHIGEFDIVFYGDTAVVSFQAEVNRLEGAEKSSQKLTFVDVYHKDPGGWIQVASNTSLHPDAIFHMMSQRRTLDDGERASLMKVREDVWRAWFAGDRDRLTEILVPELITLESGGGVGTLQSTLNHSRDFAASGGKLTRLEFPNTQLQAYGNTVILYSSYVMDLQIGGQTQTERGMATEIFLNRDGKWVHTGWQLAPVTK